ncbi:MAG: ribosomal protein S18-alanine N-acetyltransferase [Firmicutes bacterium]|nr:ribosomal protein S18-alanine N-acetyltransferase [Bacillota bacterium]
MKIVEMNRGHVPQVASLEKRCFPDPWPEAALLPELENPLSYWLVAVEGERVAGYIGSQSVLGESDMMNLAVAPEFRRQGIGRALADRLMADLYARGNKKLTLEVRASNEAAIALYARLGFTRAGIRKGYYLHPREDAYIYTRELCE